MSTITPAGSQPGPSSSQPGPSSSQPGPATTLTPVGLDIRERRAFQQNGYLGILLGLGLLALAGYLGYTKADQVTQGGSISLPAMLGIPAIALLASLILGGIAVVQPGQRLVVQFLGAYIGTVSRSGLVWLLPLTTRRKISVRVRAVETAHLKVNDADGNPVEIAGIVVWQIADSAKALFAVENAEAFVYVQAEAALRHIARSYPYDAADGVESLRGSTEVLAQELAAEVRERAAAAGIQVVEVRISHLAYAPEIAQAMLQRQQAAAVIAARGLIVKGAVGIVQNALTELSEQGVVQLDDERRAAMVSNLLVVLCGESRAQPVVNAGTLYS